MFAVNYIWELPRPNTADVLTSWTRVNQWGPSNDTIKVVVGSYINQPINPETLLARAIGSCGLSRDTARSRITISSATHNIELKTNHHSFDAISTVTHICEDSILKVWAHNASTLGTITAARWNYQGITEIKTVDVDTLEFKIPSENFVITVDFLIDGDCGYTQGNSQLSVNVGNQPAMPVPLQSPFPCEDVPFEMNVFYDQWTDSISWDWDKTPGVVPEFEIFSTENGSVPNDSLYFGGVGSTPFDLIVTAYNQCGTRQNTMTITPSEDIIENLDVLAVFNAIDTVRFCSGDTAVIHLNIPTQHTQIRPTYHWTLPPGWTQARPDSLDVSGEANIVWLIPSDTAGNISVYADGCGQTSTSTRNASVTPTIIQIETGQSHFVANYRATNVEFFVESISSATGPTINASNIDDFDLTWTPPTRFQTAIGDTARLIFAFMAEEQFMVHASEKTVPAGQKGCTATAKVNLRVDHAFEFRVEHPNAVCLNSDFPVIATSLGGEPTTYSQRWYRDTLGTGTFTLFGTTTDSIVRLDQKYSVPGGQDMQFMVVGVSELFTSPGIGGSGFGADVVVVFSDAVFTVKAMDSLIASIVSVEMIQLIGDQIRVLDTFADPNFGAVKLGERLFIQGGLEGRSEEEYTSLIFQWGNEAELDQAGFTPDSTHLQYAFSGLIFTPQTYFFAVMDTDAYGCFDLDSVRVEIRELVGDPKFDFGEIPGAFTPHNNDGINDVFMENVDEITILNRWGAIIYEAKGDRAKNGWNGRNPRTGRMVDKGDYFYIITIYDIENNNKPHTKTGVVTVL
ncbi:MAG: gliding motility-associated C-terminal domain-containing protein, partial [Bacteroidales bacterium]|nr:gliding motility-associated C-terminal domain-containing protein [Bacteroidales bacterium]